MNTQTQMQRKKETKNVKTKWNTSLSLSIHSSSINNNGPKVVLHLSFVPVATVLGLIVSSMPFNNNLILSKCVELTRKVSHLKIAYWPPPIIRRACVCMQKVPYGKNKRISIRSKTNTITIYKWPTDTLLLYSPENILEMLCDNM